MNYSSQRGAAFIYMMLIFAAASVIAAGLLAREHLAIIRTSRFLDDLQATQYAYGVEAYARQLLYDDMEHHGEMDYVGEAWSGQQSVFTVPDGSVEMEIEDLRGRFNVNSLLDGNSAAADHFRKLCLHLDIERDVAEKLLAHFPPMPAAPETARGSPAAPKHWLADASELIDAGLSADAYAKLAPYLSALPSASYNINLNTAPDAVLAAYLPDSAIAAVHDMIKKNGYVDADHMGELQIHDSSLSVVSDAFRARATVTINGRATRLSSTLLRADRNGQKAILTTARAWNEAFIP